MKIFIAMAIMLFSVNAYAADAYHFADNAKSLLIRNKAGISLDRYSDLYLDLTSEATALLQDEKIKELRDYEYLKKHVEKIVELFYALSQLKKHSERDGYKFISITGYEYSGIRCFPVAIGDIQGCRIADLQETAEQSIEKEINVIRSGIQEGF